MLCCRLINVIVVIIMFIGVCPLRFSSKTLAWRSLLRALTLRPSKSSIIAENGNNDYVVGSFFRFCTLSDERIANILQKGKGLSEWPVTGTLLIASEGVNGQFALPVALLDRFPSILAEIDADLFSSTKLNLGQPFSKNELLSEAFPFKKLLIKRKKEVLTDNIAESIDWNEAGPELSPEKWHEEIDPAKSPILLDCRNQYESELGSFEGAIPLNTSKFSDSWPALDQLLKDVPPDRRILTYCTGGIRCVKVNAYLKQKLGFQNIGRLEQGIIAYERWLTEQRQQCSGEEQVQSRFNGKNFLFDRRRLMDEGSPQQLGTSSSTGTVLELELVEDEKSDKSKP